MENSDTLAAKEKNLLRETVDGYMKEKEKTFEELRKELKMKEEVIHNLQTVCGDMKKKEKTIEELREKLEEKVEDTYNSENKYEKLLDDHHCHFIVK